jgi:hypothetical protein
MNDIIERLRETHGDNSGLCYLAADEIERLRGALTDVAALGIRIADELAETRGLLREATAGTYWLPPTWYDKARAFLTTADQPPVVACPECGSDPNMHLSSCTAPSKSSVGG